MKSFMQQMQRARHVGVALALGVALAAPGLASAHAGMHDGADVKRARISGPLVDKVRAATGKYVDINVAHAEGWVQATPCVSGPAAGAMGVHLVLPSRLTDGMLKGDEPEALIYEPQANGAMRLVGVEFIVFASDWDRLHPTGPAPSVDGHLANFVGKPNRYGLDPFYELHVWAWEDNPSGTFADFNTQVSCDRQAAPAT